MKDQRRYRLTGVHETRRIAVARHEPGYGRRAPHLFVGLLLLAAGCGSVDPLGPVHQVGQTFEEFAARVPREPHSGIYVVDGDTPIRTLDELRAFYEEYVRGGALTINNTGRYYTDTIWDDTQRQNLSYCVSTTFGTRYNAVVQAMAAAAADWQNAAPIQFVYAPAQDTNCTSSNNNVLFNVSPTSSGQFLAAAFFPDWARAQRTLWIDGTAFTSLPFPQTVTGVLRHELGHVLGFRHEHVRPQAGGVCTENDDWAPVTAYDSNSVMHYPWCRGTNTGDLVLTTQDRAGAALVYGNAPFVGVIPAANGCPTSAPEVRLNMDNEDRNTTSDLSGWVGGTRQDGNGNTRFVFCRVDGSQFRALSSGSSPSSNYAVLKMSGRCPAGAVEFSRYFDNEDNDNANSSSGLFWPSVMHNNTKMVFCLFRGGGTAGSTLPNLGFDYGVFAESSFSHGGAKGVIFTDNEDNNTLTSYVADAAWKADATRIVSDGENATLRTARRAVCGDLYCSSGAENLTTCPSDCEPCGNGLCRYDETVYNCPRDCAQCGDGICTVGESCEGDCGSSCYPQSRTGGRLPPSCP